MKQPALWSLEERNLYKLVTEVESGGTITDRYETRFGIRTSSSTRRRASSSTANRSKLKGTCNHQDHAGMGTALPDAVQYFRVRKLQEMGCNAFRTSHNPPTPELLDACDELGMLVLDETRMLSSNPDGLVQFENMIRRDRNHPSVFIWSMGNEESISPTETGLRLLTSMKRVANEAGRFPADYASRRRPLETTWAKAGSPSATSWVTTTPTRRLRLTTRANPTVPVLGTEKVTAVGTRGVYETDRAKGYVSSYDPYTTTGRASAEGWWRFCQRAAVDFRRVRLDRFRLSRRAVAVRVAEHQLAVRHHRHLRVPEGHASTTTSRGGLVSRCCTCSRTGTGPASKARTSRFGSTPTWTGWSCSTTARAWAPRT